MNPDEFFTHNKGGVYGLVRRDSVSFLGQCQFISVLISFYSMMSVIHTEVTLLDSLNFPRACVLCLARADSVEVFADAGCYCRPAIRASMCSPRYVPCKSSSVHLRTATTSTGNTVERLPIGLLSLWLSINTSAKAVANL
jgi:hypothetical protein